MHPGDKPVARFVAQSAGLGACVLFGIAACIVWSISGPGDSEAPSEQAQERAAKYEEVHAAQMAAISKAGWVDEKAGIATIPVSAAKPIVLAELKAKKAAPSKALIPGATAPTPEKPVEKPEPKPEKPKDAPEKPADTPQKPDTEAEAPEAPPEPPADPELVEAGKTVYNSYCVACHAPDAKANLVPGMAPSLVGSKILLGPSEQPVMTLLHGIKPATPQPRFTGVMVAWKDILDDRQIAGVISYLRTNFGNSGSIITPEQVAWARAKYADQTEQFPRETIESTNSYIPYPVPEAGADDASQKP